MAVSFDRISLLPIELLLTIVSLLPFKEAVKTSVLSREWLKVCKFTKNIEFNELFFVKADQTAETKEIRRRAFLDFIHFWIENYNGTEVEKLSIRLPMPGAGNGCEVIHECLAFATQRGVKDLDLDFADPHWNENNIYYGDHNKQFELPAQIYKHSSLECLKLYSCSFVETEMLHFDTLKEVSLGWMEVRLSAIKALLSNCKMVESLSLKKCWNSDKFDLGQEEYTGLRKLVLDKCHFGFENFFINAPNLKTFKYCGLMNFFIQEIHSPVVEEANLDFSLEYGFEGNGHPLCNLVQSLSSARVFTLCSFVLQDYELPFVFDRTQFWIDNVGVYECMSSSLEVVEINGFTGFENELLVLMYFIINGHVLRKISINILKDGSGRTMEPQFFENAEFLLTVPRASRNLVISIF